MSDLTNSAVTPVSQHAWRPRMVNVILAAAAVFIAAWAIMASTLTRTICATSRGSLGGCSETTTIGWSGSLAVALVAASAALLSVSLPPSNTAWPRRLAAGAALAVACGEAIRVTLV